MIFDKDKAKMEFIEKQITSLESALSNSQCEIRNLIAIRKDYEDLKSRYTTLKTKLREQNEADLMYVSMKIIEEIKAGKTVAELGDLIKEQEMIQAQRRNLENLALQQRGVGLAGGSALGGIFG